MLIYNEGNLQRGKVVAITNMYLVTILYAFMHHIYLFSTVPFSSFFQCIKDFELAKDIHMLLFVF